MLKFGEKVAGGKSSVVFRCGTEKRCLSHVSLTVVVFCCNFGTLFAGLQAPPRGGQGLGGWGQDPGGSHRVGGPGLGSS